MARSLRGRSIPSCSSGVTTAGIEALGVDGAVEQPAFTAAYAESLLPLLLAEREDEIDYVAEVRRLLAEPGSTSTRRRSGGSSSRSTRHGSPRTLLAPDALDLMDALHARGVLVGLVSNLFDPPALARARLGAMGVLERLDAVALSAEVGERKPSAAIFEHALARLGVAPRDTVFVGDRLREDVQGASALGMRTILADVVRRGSGAAARARTRGHAGRRTC